MGSLLDQAEKQNKKIQSKENSLLLEAEEPKPKKFKNKKEEITIETMNKEPGLYPMEIIKAEHSTNTPLYEITKEDVKAHLDMYNFVKTQIVNESDFATIKNRKFLKKSGVRKFINAFGISIELIEKNIFALNGDTHAEVRVRAITQKGQSVEGIGLKSMSELYEKSLHNLVTIAWTRAVNRAILDLVAFGEVSAEEISTSGKSNEDDFPF